jgi:hypothetical protein
MAEETLTPSPRNTLATIALVLAIIGVVLSFFLIGIPLLVLSLLLGIIALFKAPRGKAWASIIISAIPLGFWGWFIWMFGSILISPTIAFYNWIQEEIRTNPTIATVFKQPGFDEFMQQKLQETFTTTARQEMGLIDSINRQEITAAGSFKREVGKAIDYTYERLKGEIPAIVDAWIAQYGLPGGEEKAESSVTV